MDSIGCLTHRIISVNRVHFASYILFMFHWFLSLVALAKTSSTVLSKCGEINHHCLFILGEMLDLYCNVSYVAFIFWSIFLLVLVSSEFLSQRNGRLCQRPFQRPIDIAIDLCPWICLWVLFINFIVLNHPYMPRMKSTWLWWMISFIWGWFS